MQIQKYKPLPVFYLLFSDLAISLPMSNKIRLLSALYIKPAKHLAEGDLLAPLLYLTRYLLKKGASLRPG